MSDQPVACWTIRKEAGSSTLKWFAFVAYEAKVSGTFKPQISGDDEAQATQYFTLDEAKTLQLHANTQPYFR